MIFCQEIYMISEQRYKKLRVLLKQANSERKQQAKQIDILCNDLIGAQRNFISRLKDIAFTAGFYESIMGASDYNSLFYIAGKLIAQNVSDVNVGFVLRGEDDFHLFVAEGFHIGQKNYLYQCLDNELVENICRSRQLCDLNGMLELGLKGSPSRLKDISASAIPLGGYGVCSGFVLLSKDKGKKLKASDMDTTCSVIPGLSRAVSVCSAKTPSKN